MSSWLWNNGNWQACESLPVTDRGFRYGMSLFETMRLAGRRALFLEEHLASLRAACADRGFPLEEAALRSVAELVKEQPDGVARLYVTAGDGGPFADRVTESRLLVLCEERPEPVLAPCTLNITEEVYHPAFNGLKTGNYWRNIDALHHARRAGYDETLLFNEHSELVSCAMANVFVVVGEQIWTPRLECGARAGITRAWVEQQVPVCECSIFVGDLLEKAQEIFITNSWYGVRPVTRLQGRELPEPKVGARLAESFRTLRVG